MTTSRGPRITALENGLDALAAYAALDRRDAPAILLENQTAASPRSRLFFDPIGSYEYRRDRARLEFRGDVDEVPGAPLHALRRLFSATRPSFSASDAPGGLAGFIAYDIRCALERLGDANPADVDLPDLWFGAYDSVLECEGTGGDARARVVLWPRPDDVDGSVRLDRFRAALARGARTIPVPNVAPTRLPARSNLTRDQFERRIERIHEHIAAGDVYQVNFTHRYVVESTLDPVGIFARLRRVHPSPHAALMRLGATAIVSASPERFVKGSGSILETRPIKGTRPRFRDPDADRAAAEQLLSSAKDDAELSMIVDLMRNDLNRVSIPGSVVVKGHAMLESAPTVHHLVSSIEGELEPPHDIFDFLTAALPAGSITGCPKIRAMEIIEELETIRRGIYTGNIGTIEWNGETDLSVAIRTMVCRDGRVYIHGGGGIVRDSRPDREFEESVAKIRGLIEALGGVIES